MTAKDKKLLTIAVAVLIVLAIIVVGIKPMFTKYQEANAKKAELKVEKVNMETEINNLSNYEMTYQNAAKDYSATASRVFGDLDKAGVQDAVVNELVAKCQLSPSNLAIPDFSNISVTPYKIQTESQEENTSTSSTGSSVRTVNVSFNAVGTADQIMNLIDLLNSDEGIFVEQFGFTPSADATSVSINLVMLLSESY